jgi:hypothetical protein
MDPDYVAWMITARAPEIADSVVDAGVVEDVLQIVAALQDRVERLKLAVEAMEAA